MLLGFQELFLLDACGAAAGFAAGRTPQVSVVADRGSAVRFSPRIRKANGLFVDVIEWGEPGGLG